MTKLSRLWCLTLAIGFCLAPLAAGDFVRTFSDPTPNAHDSFGRVAVDGHYILIGAPSDDTNGIDVGQAHLFDLRTGSLLHTFNDPTPTSRDLFGQSVAITEDYVLIGANGDDTNGDFVGQAHLFDAVSGNHLHTFNDPTPTNRDSFGGNVAIDGDYVLIGATGDDTIGDGVGQAHLFDAITGNLLRTFNDPTVTSRDAFGTVAIDGDYVLIGAFGDNTNGFNKGQAYLFDVATGNHLHTFNDPTIVPSMMSDESFGVSLAIDGDRVLIGSFGQISNSFDATAGEVHLFDAVSGSFLRTFQDPDVNTFDYFGSGLAIQGDLLVVGAPGSDLSDIISPGQTHLFDLNTGELLQTLKIPNAAGDARYRGFGSGTALSGNYLAVGQYEEAIDGLEVGQVRLYDVSKYTVPEPSAVSLLLTLSSLFCVSSRKVREPIA